jgi:hypothetical protein
MQQAIVDQTERGDLFNFKTPLKPLLPFENRLIYKSQAGIQLHFEEYLGLVDWTGRIIPGDSIDSPRSLIRDRTPT